MLSMLDRGLTLCDGLTRREALRVGGIGLGGLSFPQLLHSQRARAEAGIAPRAKNVIIFGLVGGPAQHETWDPKPEAPVEVRGEFGAIATKTPGLYVGEMMPRTARLTDKIAVLRAVVTRDNAHSSSGYQLLTGVPHVPLNAESVTAKAPNLAPSWGAMVRYLRPSRGQLPSAVTLPEHIWNDGNFPWPGQDAGVLGPKFDPWLLTCDPSAATFKPPALTLPEDIPTRRFESRRSLLSELEHRRSPIGAAEDQYGNDVQQAFGVLATGATRRAFDLDLETPQTRDRYGRSRFAQSVLLARRLVEAGVSLVQVNWTRIADQPNQGGWDTHATHNAAYKNLLMPIMDQCYSALIEDLDQRGLLDETLVVWMGEFGRTPRFNANAGRDHWGNVFSLALCGGGIRGGVVHGQSDSHAAYPVSGIVEPADLCATVFHQLGYTPDTMLHDQLGRPIPLSRGRIIQAVL